MRILQDINRKFFTEEQKMIFTPEELREILPSGTGLRARCARELELDPAWLSAMLEADDPNPTYRKLAMLTAWVRDVLQAEAAGTKGKAEP
jgi:hypothetical protein